MPRYICPICGQESYSAADPEHLRDKRCPRKDCGGIIAPAAENERNVEVHIGGSFYEVREADVIEQVRKNYQRSGFVHALRFYRSLIPDVSYSDAKDTVLAWCGNLKEGSVMIV